MFYFLNIVAINMELDFWEIEIIFSILTTLNILKIAKKIITYR